MAKEEIDKMLGDSSATIKATHAEFLKSVKNSLQKYKTETLGKFKL